MGIFESIRNALGNRESAEVAGQAPGGAPGDAGTEADGGAAPRTATVNEAGERTYTVQSGDTLWRIADRVYGDGSRFMRIFEANADLLDAPDRIFPGQQLKIPNLVDEESAP